MPRPQGELIHIGSRRRLPDRAHAGRGRDLIHGPDNGQDRALDVGEGDQPVLDNKPALEHPVVGDELAQEIGHGRAGPGHPSVSLEEPASALAGEQSLAVVELEDELDTAAQAT